MLTHGYTPKFDGINYDGKQLPGRDPQTGRFVASTPDVHDPAWHDEMSHTKETDYIPLEEIPSEMGIGFEAIEDCEGRIFGESADDPYVDEYDTYFWEQEYYGFTNGSEYHDKYAVMAARYGLDDFDGGFTTVDDCAEQETVVFSLNGEEISPEEVDDVFCSMIFTENVGGEGDFVPRFSGTNRTLVRDRFNRLGDGWWNEGSKDRHAVNGKRRNKGITRAPKWQRFAGGRKAALQSIKHLPVD